MMLGMIFFAVIGWIGGVHLPWWGVLTGLGLGIYSISKSQGIDGAIGDVSTVVGILSMILGHLLIGDSFTFEGLGGVLGFLFTGS